MLNELIHHGFISLSCLKYTDPHNTMYVLVMMQVGSKKKVLYNYLATLYVCIECRNMSGGAAAPGALGG